MPLLRYLRHPRRACLPGVERPGPDGRFGAKFGVGPFFCLQWAFDWSKLVKCVSVWESSGARGKSAERRVRRIPRFRRVLMDRVRYAAEEDARMFGFGRRRFRGVGANRAG